jgi:two-component system sensor histidine kinase RegB
MNLVSGVFSERVTKTKVPNLSLSARSFFSSDSEQLESATQTDLLMNLRVFAIIGQCLVIWPAIELEWLRPSLVGPYCLVVFLLGLLTAGSFAALRWQVIKPTQGFIFFQLTIDTLALSLLLRFSGGPWNPFVSLILFHAALGALNLKGPWLTYFVLFIAWCLALVHWNPILPPALAVQPTPSSVLFPIQSLVLLLFVGLLIWSRHQLEQHRETIRRIREEKNQLDRLRAFGVMATGFSHEFATPLATLKLKLTRLKNQGIFADSADLEIALLAASQAEQSLKRMMNQKFIPEKHEFTQIEVVSTIESIITCVANEDSTFDFKPCTSKVWLTAPQLSFHQMILDLFDNALRANKEKGSKTICVRIDTHLSYVDIEINDSGPGFPQWILNNVGTPFFSTRAESSGLGLYHAHVLCLAMGGELVLSNVAESGAKVLLRLPVVQGKLP